MNTKIAQLRHQTDPDRYNKLLAEIRQELSIEIEKIRKGSLSLAESLGTRTHFISEEELNNRIKNVCAEFRKLKTIVRLHLNPNSQGHAGKQEAEQFGTEISELELEASDLKTKLANDPRNYADAPEPVKWYEYLAIYSPFILLGASSLYEAAAFRLFAGMMILALGIAVGFGIAQYYVIRFVTQKLLTWENKQKKLMLIIGVLVGAAVTFFGVGILRNMFMEKQHTAILNGPVVFMFISLVFFIGAWIGEFVATPFREMIRAKEAKLDNYKSFADEKVKHHELAEHAKQQKQERNVQLTSRIIVMDNSDSFMKRIQDEYESTIAEIKAVYLQFRANRDGGIVPDYFKTIVIPPVIDADDWSLLRASNNNSNYNSNPQIHTQDEK